MASNSPVSQKKLKIMKQTGISTKKAFVLITALAICAAAQLPAALTITNGETLTYTGGTFTAGTSTTSRWYGEGAGSSATGGNPGQFMRGADFNADKLTFVTFPAPFVSENWTITYDFRAAENFSGNNRFFVIGLATGATLLNQTSISGMGVSVISTTPRGIVSAWTSFGPSVVTIPAGLSAVAIGIQGNTNSATFGLDNLNITSVPEPSSMTLLGLAASLLVRRRRNA